VKKTCNTGIWSLGSDAIKPRLNDALHRFDPPDPPRPPLDEDPNFEIGPMQPLIAVKRATMLLRFDWLLGLIGALLS
jgi:hypothetical protein